MCGGRGLFYGGLVNICIVAKITKFDNDIFLDFRAAGNQLFALESEYAALIPEERYTQRQEHSKKVLDDFYAWLEMVNPLQGTGLAKAVQYARNEKSYLYAFLEDPQIPIDNNLAERAVKPFVIGRKNRLFSTSPKGADASAAAYSIINTAQANGIDVREYLTNIFRTSERRLPLKSE